jgi:hypothetical protein
MRDIIRRSALIAVVPVLSLTAACSPGASGADLAADAETAASAAAGAGRGKPNAAPASRKQDVGPTNVDEKSLPGYQAVADCLQRHGVAVPDPQVGVPFDTSAVDRAWGTPKVEKALAGCPGYAQVIVGMG